METNPLSDSLRAALPVLLPKAIAWAEEQSAFILQNGDPLNPQEMELAEALGIAQPSVVRVLGVTNLPLPDDAELRQAAVSLGLLGPAMVGLTLGYGIYIVYGHRTNRLLSHELRHVYQYEQADGIESFLPEYVEQLLSFGYADAPLEVDAKNHEQP